MIIRAFPWIAVLLLTGCAAATPGYSPLAGGVPEPRTVDVGEIGTGGLYVMSATERQLDCGKTTGAMMITIARLKDRARSTPPSGAAGTLKTVVSPLFGGSSTNNDGDTARERAKLAAYNHHLAQKGCRTVDIEAEFAKPAVTTAVRY